MMKLQSWPSLSSEFPSGCLNLCYRRQDQMHHDWQKLLWILQKNECPGTWHQLEPRDMDFRTERMMSMTRRGFIYTIYRQERKPSHPECGVMCLDSNSGDRNPMKPPSRQVEFHGYNYCQVFSDPFLRESQEWGKIHSKKQIVGGRILEFWSLTLPAGARLRINIIITLSSNPLNNFLVSSICDLSPSVSRRGTAGQHFLANLT